MHYIRDCFAILLLISLICVSTQAATPSEESAWLGARIFQNETGGERDLLLYWSESEEFPSLGIGHFIWIPDRLEVPFEDSFPQMVSFLVERGVSLPAKWVAEPHPPWQDRAHYLSLQSSPETKALRQWLYETRSEQALFIAARFQSRMTKLIENLPPTSHQIVSYYDTLMQSKAGRFALIDYSHFKGFGDNPHECYHHYGWGLLQVLEMISTHFDSPIDEKNLSSDDLLALFQEAARAVLSRRVQHAPPERNEAQWLAGWFKRIDGYGRE